MKNLVKLSASLFVLFFLVQATTVFGQSRMETRHFLMRTHRVIERAKETVAAGKVYTGDVTRAVYHQRFAWALFKEGKFDRAIHHSWRARELAHAAIHANKGKVEHDMEFEQKEQSLGKDKPDNASLDVEVKIPAGSDDKVVIKEKEEVKE